MKKEMKLKNKFSKRFIYFFVTLGILVFLTGGVYAIASSGTNSGHPASDIDFSSGINSLLKVTYEPTYAQTSLHTWGLSSDGTMYLEPTKGNNLYIVPGDWSQNLYTVMYGNLGIGTTYTDAQGTHARNPSEKLEVNGNIKWGSSTLSTDQKGSIELGDSGTSGVTPYIDFHYGKGTAQDYNVRLINDADGQLSLKGNLVTSGSISAGSFLYTSSDRNLKTDIKPLQDSLQKVLQLQGVSFNWKSTGQPSIGLIAQDVEKVFPEIVATDSKTGLKSVAYENLIAPLIESVKEQQKEINNLQEQINELKSKCN